MAFQSVPDCAEAVVHGWVNSVNVANVLNFAKIGGNYTQTDINLLALAVDGWFAAEVLPFLSNQTNYVETTTRGLENINDFEGMANVGADPGGATDEPLPGQVSFAIKFTSGLTGRSARGRAYLWGINVTQLNANENQLDATYADAYVAAYEALPATVAAVGWAHVIVSRYTGGVQRAQGVYFPVTGYSYTDLRLDTQRRRLG